MKPTKEAVSRSLKALDACLDEAVPFCIELERQHYPHVIMATLGEIIARYFSAMPEPQRTERFLSFILTLADTAHVPIDELDDFTSETRH